MIPYPATLTGPKELKIRAAPYCSGGIAMKNRTTLAIATMFLSLALPAAAQLPAYHANLMGISDGRTNLQLEHIAGLNRWGQVIGTYGGGLSGGTHAVLWTPASANDGSGNAIDNTSNMFSLELSPGMPAGTANTFATSLNDRGQIVGQAFTPGKGDGNQLQSWMWKPKTLNSNQGILHGSVGTNTAFALFTIPGADPTAQYNQVLNNKGSIGAHGEFYRAMLWNPTKPNATSGAWTYDPNNGGGAAAINDSGQYAGSSCSNATWNGPYLHNGPLPLVVTDILTSPLWEAPNPNECVGSVGGMNASGDLAISAVSSSVHAIHAYLYKKGKATDLSPAVGNGFTGEAFSINNHDQVVGHVDSDTRRAILFQGSQVLDLNQLNDSTNGLLLKEAIAINDAGQILCQGVYPGANASVLLTPNALVINPVSVSTGILQQNGSTYTQTITVTNLGTATIPGPISVALDGLNAKVTLTNAAGTTFYTGPGSVYANVSNSDLAAGATTSSFTLTFSNPKLVAIKFKGRVLGTSAPR
jgi:hypothetical protein